jgi:S1-C subfamily serine protease
VHNANFMKPSWFALLALLTALALGVLSAAPPAVDGPTVKLAPLKVNDDPINCFGFDLKIYYDKKTDRVTRIFFGEVLPESSAAELDVQAGDEIKAINGRPVTEFSARVTIDTELGKLFLARRPGEKLDLAVVRHRAATVTVTAGFVTPLSRP